MANSVVTDYGSVSCEIIGAGLDARIRLRIGDNRFDLRLCQSQWIAQLLFQQCREVLGHPLDGCQFCGHELTGKEFGG